MMEFRMFDCLHDFASDVLLETFMYLSHVDCCTLGSTNKMLKTCTSDERLWTIYCKTRIFGFKDYLRTKEELNTIRYFFHFQNYKQLYHCLKSLQFHLFGFFRLVPQDLDACTGGLFYLFPSDGMVLCQYIDHEGKRQLDERTYALTYDPNAKSVVCFPYNKDGSNKPTLSKQLYSVKFTDSLEFHEQHLCQQIPPMQTPFSTIKNCCNSDKMTIMPMPGLLSSPRIFQVPNYDTYFPCLGLFTSRYGSHGNEILHLSLHHEDDPSFLHFPDQPFQSLQLQGLKITGDKNVPAGQFSFVIDLLNSVDFQSTFLHDSRPIIVFPSHSYSPIVTSWHERLPYMQFFARGFGQINRFPGQWSPEWVSCGFIFYKHPIHADQIVFSIIWDDEVDPYRHAMDFSSVDLTSLA